MILEDGKRIENLISPNTCINICDYNIVRKVNSRGEYVDVCCSDIKVGDIVKVNHNERVPADMLLIHTSDKQGGIFLKTDQLDGETDWKFREAIL